MLPAFVLLYRHLKRCRCELRATFSSFKRLCFLLLVLLSPSFFLAIIFPAFPPRTSKVSKKLFPPRTSRSRKSKKKTRVRLFTSRSFLGLLSLRQNHQLMRKSRCSLALACSCSSSLQSSRREILQELRWCGWNFPGCCRSLLHSA